jgi:hypothetical protein
MRVLFYVAKRYSIPVVLPIAEVCRSKGIPSGFYVSRKVLEVLPEAWGREPVFTDRREASRFAPDSVVCPGNFVDFRLPGVKVQVFHGLGVEKPAHYRIRHFFDVYCTSGPLVTERFERLRQRWGYFLVRETGWPKVDHILSFDATGLRRRWDLPEDRRVILYAPTVSSGMESATDLLPVIPGCAREDEVWLCKLHELAEAGMEEAARRLGGIDNVRLVDTYDVTPLLHLADVLVSDTSSVVYEAMVLGRPVVTYRTLARPEKAVDITEPGRLREAVDGALSAPPPTEVRKRLEEVNPHLDGRCSERVVSLLEELHARPGALPDDRKPLNLFRKMQVIWHGMFRKGYLR